MPQNKQIARSQQTPSRKTSLWRFNERPPRREPSIQEKQDCLKLIWCPTICGIPMMKWEMSCGGRRQNYCKQRISCMPTASEAPRSQLWPWRLLARQESQLLDFCQLCTHHQHNAQCWKIQAWKQSVRACVVARSMKYSWRTPEHKRQKLKLSPPFQLCYY